LPARRASRRSRSPLGICGSARLRAVSSELIHPHPSAGISKRARRLFSVVTMGARGERFCHRCARGARDGGDTMESCITVHLLTSPASCGASERVGVTLVPRDGAVVETKNLTVTTDAALGKSGDIQPRDVPDSDSPDKPPTPPSRLSLDQLRAEIDAAVRGLPEILRVCTVDALTERVAPVFHETDHVRCAPVSSSQKRASRKPKTENRKPKTPSRRFATDKTHPPSFTPIARTHPPSERLFPVSPPQRVSRRSRPRARRANGKRCARP
jgi:hypothetical protein